MTRFILIDGTDEGDRTYLETITIVQCANAGEVGIGGFDVRDIELDPIPAHKSVVINETAATPQRMFGGYTGERGLSRGREGTITTRREWDVTILDLNTVLDDEVFQSDGANRPEETDYARISWLLTTGAITDLGITAGVVPNTNTVTLDATDYRGQGPREVLGDAAEAAQKTYFVYDFGSGRKLYYDKFTGTSLSSSLKLSSVFADVDSTTVLALHEPRLTLDPKDVFSTVRLKYANGVVWSTNATTVTDFRRREIPIERPNIQTEAKAQAVADQLADVFYASERRIFTCAVRVSESQVNDIQAGQRIEIKCPHLDINDFAWFRITRRTVTPLGSDAEDEYYISLEFAEDLAAGPGNGGGSDKSYTDETNTTTVEETGTTDDTPLTITEMEARREIVNFNAANEDDTFTYESPAAGEYVGSYIQYWITQSDPDWPCAGLGIFFWTGLKEAETWLEVDLSGGVDPDWIGIRFSGPAADPTPDVSGAAAASAEGFPFALGWGYADPTALGEYTFLTTFNPFEPWEIFIPRNLLTADVNALVLAPLWHARGSFCGTELVDNSRGPLIGGEGQSRFYRAGDETYTAVPVLVAGSGKTQWVPGIGDIDGTNAEFELSDWDGTGVPEARIDGLIAAAGDYEYDSGAGTVTFYVAPVVGAAVAFRYNHS